MAGAPRGNTNALKHGLYAGLRQRAPLSEAQIRKATFAILHLEQVIDAIQERMKEADTDEFVRLANALSLASTALFNGHRTISYVSGLQTPMEEALKELKGLKLAED